jgi:hypothetical protein
MLLPTDVHSGRGAEPSDLQWGTGAEGFPREEYFCTAYGKFGVAGCTLRGPAAAVVDEPL